MKKSFIALVAAGLLVTLAHAADAPASSELIGPSGKGGSSMDIGKDRADERKKDKGKAGDRKHGKKHRKHDGERRGKHHDKEASRP